MHKTWLFIRLLTISVYFLTLIPVSLLYSREVDIGTIIAYPNPFSPNTSIKPLTFRKSENGMLVGFSGEVKIIVYSSDLGQVYEREYSTPSVGEPNLNVFWSGVDSNGNRVSSGLYYIRFIENRVDGTFGSKLLKIIVR